MRQGTVSVELETCSILARTYSKSPSVKEFPQAWSDGCNGLLHDVCPAVCYLVAASEGLQNKGGIVQDMSVAVNCRCGNVLASTWRLPSGEGGSLHKDTKDNLHLL